MALSDMLVESVLKSSQKAPDIAGSLSSGIKQGAELAGQIEAMQLKREALESQKQQLEMDKLNRVSSWYETGAKMDPGPARTAYMNQFIPQGIAALKLSTPINPVVQKMLSAEPLLAARLVSEIRNGKMNVSALTDPSKVGELAMGLKQYGDEQKFRETVTEYLPQLQEAEKFALSEEGKSARAAAMSGQQKEKNIREDIDSLRKEFTSNPVSKETKEINSSFDRIQSSFMGESSAAADMAGIFAYMKMLDPGSTVREGEFANAQNAAGVPDRIINAYNRAKNGELLNPEQRKDFLMQAEKIKARQEMRQEQINKQFTELAIARGYKPTDILAGVDVRKASPKADRFKGMSKEAQDILIRKRVEREGISAEEARKKYEEGK